MKYGLIVLFFASISFSSCMKEEVPIKLPPAGQLKQMQAVLGSTYVDQVYISLSQNKTWTASAGNYDLAFETDPNSHSIYLNGAKMMFAIRSGTFSFDNADTIGKIWRVDAEHLDADSTAIGQWWSPQSLSSAGKSKVFIIDLGRFSNTNHHHRYKKIQVLQFDSTQVTVAYADLQDEEEDQDTLIIPKDKNFSLMYFSFGNNGQLVYQAPPASEWDFVFTKYTHVFFDQPLNSPYRYYPVVGGLINRWNNTTGLMLEKDSTSFYVPFSDYNFSHVTMAQFTNAANVIGYDWKIIDINTALYTIPQHLYYVLKCADGFYYKLRVLDFYDQSGTKGTVTFEYQRI